MAGHLKFAVSALLMLAATANAQSLPDPTKPPAGFGADAAGGTMIDVGPRLQSVIVPRKGRPTAVISGQTVRVGETVGTGRLVRLTESEAVIEGPDGSQTLKLTPDVEKMPIAAKKGKKMPAITKESP